jgi:hypothetical protein
LLFQGLPKFCSYAAIKPNYNLSTIDSVAPSE